MSIPHTTKPIAKIKGHNCLFDGDTWNTPDSQITEELNFATAHVPKHHSSINEIAEHVFRDLQGACGGDY